MSSNLSLPALFARALASASKAYNLPTVEEDTQVLVRSSLADLAELNGRIAGLSVFSSNEILEDVATRDLAYLLVPYVISEVHNRVRTTTREARLESLRLSQRCLAGYLTNLEDLEVIPESERVLHTKKIAEVADPAKRRELKIKQYQQEKELRTRIEVLRKRRRQTPVDTDSSSDFALIACLLPSTSANGSNEQGEDSDEEDSETEDVLRETTLLLLRLMHAQAHASIVSMAQELELLKNAPPPSAFIEEERAAEAEDVRKGKEKKNSDDPDMWKVDSPLQHAGGPLLDPEGKPLRPFTILPSGTADRAKIAAGVFGPGHNLPTMSIDEYLQIEHERGNVITGGGAASEAALTTSEQLQLDSEFDGTSFAEERAEAKRQKDENWAKYTDENAKGAGNTMNRG